MAFTIKAARVNAGIMQKEAAKMIGISIITLQNYEAYRSKPNIETAQKMAALYGMTVDDIQWSERN